ncbi:unnamed protein product [Clavelina lepadiformis]|uniref:Major facilitator superfamily (MFS) profile domain-containing protein n=1 Tax=Clavelina lepadiformis TaxID=159417 RepID=A0ABP0FVK7_CLALP
MDVDDCYAKVVGSIGRYQILIYSVLGLYGLSLPCISVGIVFFGADPSELRLANNRIQNDSTFLMEWGLLEKQWISDLTQSIFFAGFLFGVIVFGQLSDHFGRYAAMVTGYWLFLPTCFLSSFSTSWQMFATFRFFTGFLGGGVTLVQYIYLQEIVGQSWWALTGSIQNSFFAFALVLLCVCAYYLPQWRHLLQLVTYLQIPPLLFLCFLSESPRWLYSKGRLQDAEKVLIIIAKRNGVKNPVLSLKIRSIAAKPKKVYTMVDLIKHKETLKRIGVMAYIWFVNSLVYYALTFAANDIGSNTYVSEALSGLIELPSVVLCAILLNRKWCGRKRAVYSSMILSGIACLGLIAFKTTDKSSGKLALGLFGKLTISFSFNTIYVYAPELYPTSVRNIALGSLSMFARAGGIIASFSKSLISTNPVLGYILFGVAGVTAGFLTFLLPETLGSKPPDSFEDLDKQKLTFPARKLTENIPLSAKGVLGKDVKDVLEKQMLLNNEDEDTL